MLDLSKVKWDVSPEEKYVVKWFNDHGFDGDDNSLVFIEFSLEDIVTPIRMED